eukprot:gb/GECG01006403.1/.p1 GENE.gb/GECG01006403.1/~~gb/GECG01006403.1/.p1  ORF type:complete len:279 (+),score=7.47 gb/GECG01006403.1/:1-837(+)
MDVWSLKREWYDHFSWERAPLRSLYAPVLGSGAYLAAVAVLVTYARGRSGSKPPQKRTVTVMGHVQGIHNLILCVWSLVMCLGAGYEAYRRVVEEKSVWWMLCEHPDTAPVGRLYFWTWMYYVSKYYELLDTVVTLLKGSIPPSLGLGIYHHAVVLFMAWLWLETTQSLHIIGLLFNTFVHVFMYYYYFRRAYGHTVWWKNHITSLQIVQFATSFTMLSIVLYHLSGFQVNEWSSVCAGMPAVGFNSVFNFTLLLAFVGILNKNSRPKSREASKQKES